MKIKNDKQKAILLHKGGMLKGNVYSNVEYPESFFLCLNSGDIASLSTGNVTAYKDIKPEGWFLVDAEVVIK